MEKSDVIEGRQVGGKDIGDVMLQLREKDSHLKIMQVEQGQEKHTNIINEGVAFSNILFFFSFMSE